MKKFLNWLDRYWYLPVVIGAIGIQALVFLIFREESYLTVQDNLDLFVAHFQVMNHWDGWFSHGKEMPMLGGIDRNCLGSEFSLYNLFFMILPPFWAYMVNYFLKIFLGMGSFVLLAKDLFREQFEKYRGIAWVLGMCYGMLPLFPAYGLAFASIPLAVFILRRIYYGEGKKWYLALFCYPFVSYFSYFGFFLLAYLACAVLILSVRKKKVQGRMLIALFVLAAGYVCFEYRLFAQMLLSDEVTIRSTMVESSLDFKGVMGQIKESFVTPVFHAASDHAYFVLPVCVAFGVFTIIRRLIKRQGKLIFTDAFLGVMLLILFNCTVYGLYFSGGFRELFETLLPPLKGFQFNRTIFFNPFLWYAAFFLVLKFLCDQKKMLWKRLAALLSCIAAAVIFLTPAVYNEFYWTCYHQVYRAVKHTEVNLLNYREYFSEDLMEEIREEISYDGEYSAAYGLNPAVLEYSGIATLDGYLGFYAQDYKEAFTKLIQPSYDRVEEWQTYYGEWGARAYLYAGSGESIYNPYRNQELSDMHLYIDGEQFRAMGGRYLFSRYELSNMEELGFTLRDIFTEKASPYTIYLYETGDESTWKIAE
ncbi:MAG: hypothetical protein IJ390_03970 [Lachnospiraceae bacterium]|nr:hypothetical protein [Lachnospiraceae bacterium]